MPEKRNNGLIMLGSIMILFGLLALLARLFGRFDFWGNFWPFIVIGAGLLFFVGMLVGGKSVAGLAIPGTIITVSGATMLLQNLTGYWESWSYSWTVLIISVGLGIFIMGLWNGNADARRKGWRVMKVGIVLLIVFGSFFELILSVGRPHSPGGLIFPAALMMLGIYLVLVRSGLLRRRSRDVIDQPENQSQVQQDRSEP